jgi:hypothetical protein
MMHFIRKRCERAGNHHVQEVEIGWSDLCCENCLDRTKHWFTKMFPNVKFAPCKDIFHALKMVMGATRGPSHDLHCQFLEESVEKALEELQQENPNLTPHQATEEVPLSSKKWKTKCYNYTLPIERAAENVQKCYLHVKQDSEKLQTIAESKRKGYMGYILQRVKGKAQGHT